MKKRLLVLHILFMISILSLPMGSFSQGIGIGTITPDASAALDITTTSKGLLIPRMSITSINAIVNPAKGLLVYDSIANQLMVNMGTPAVPSWLPVASGSGWGLTGNSGTNPANQFIGNTDNQPLHFRVNNIRAGELHPVTGNIFWGLRAGQANTTGFSNIAIGTDALKLNTVANNLVAIGNSALFSNSNGDLNTAIGSQSLFSNTSGRVNTATGFQSLFSNSSGTNNTAVGVLALTANTFGSRNTAFGAFALVQNTGGNGNTAIGDNALAFTTGSTNNTAVGANSAFGVDLGFNNTLIGANAGTNQGGLFNCVALGESSRCTASSQVRLGNTFTNSIGGVVGFTNLSDGRYKKNIKDEVKGIDFIMKLRPVTYQLDITGLTKKLNVNAGDKIDDLSKKGTDENEKTIFSGFVAQEVEQAAKNAGYNFSGVDKPKNENDMYGLRYAEFVVPLVKAMQEQQQMIIELKNQNADLQKRIQTLENK